MSTFSFFYCLFLCLGVNIALALGSTALAAQIALTVLVFCVDAICDAIKEAKKP